MSLWMAEAAYMYAYRCHHLYADIIDTSAIKSQPTNIYPMCCLVEFVAQEARQGAWMPFLNLLTDISKHRRHTNSQAHRKALVKMGVNLGICQCILTARQLYGLLLDISILDLHVLINFLRSSAACQGPRNSTGTTNAPCTSSVRNSSCGLWIPRELEIEI